MFEAKRPKTPAMERQLDRILIFRIGQIGDTVAALPSLWALRQQFPNARIVMLSEIPGKATHSPPETVLPQNCLVDGFEKYPGGASLRNIVEAWRQIRRLRKLGFSTLVYLVPSSRKKKQRRRDRLFFRFAGIKKFLADKGFPENPQPRLPDGSIARWPKEADALLSRLKLDGLSVPDAGNGLVDLRLSLEERAKANDWWQRRVGDRVMPEGWVAICVGGKASNQLWPTERYDEVVRLLIDRHGLFPVIIGGTQDREVGEELVRQWGIGVCAAGELSVRESAALMSSSRFYLGNDTGVMHLAAAVGRPCVAIFSARALSGMWEPYGTGHKVLRFDVPCSGCNLTVCDKHLECLRGIEVRQVYDACLAVITQEEAKV